VEYVFVHFIKLTVPLSLTHTGSQAICSDVRWPEASEITRAVVSTSGTNNWDDLNDGGEYILVVFCNNTVNNCNMSLNITAEVEKNSLNNTRSSRNVKQWALEWTFDRRVVINMRVM